nr:hypothetical protein CRG98_004304 [Ipomoea batatas]
MEDGVAGRGAMYADGVLGGSTLGISFFQASTKVESAAVSAGRSVEKGRRHPIVVARARSREECLNMAAENGGDEALRFVGAFRERKMREGERCFYESMLCSAQLPNSYSIKWAWACQCCNIMGPPQ